MMEFILRKAALISWSITLLKTNIILGQYQEFTFILEYKLKF